jgi:small subunit ribosomal protein S4
MSRYTGPRLRVARALGCDLPGLTTNTIERNPLRPGQHGAQKQKLSDYGLRLREKQKLRFNYGVGETQLRNLMLLARKSAGSPGDKLVELLERRLDNVVFRAGFAATIPAARQLVTHGHVRLNDRRVTIPSIRLLAGDRVTIALKSRDNAHVRAALSSCAHRPDWLEFDERELCATMRAAPTTESLLVSVDLRMVVEFYANRL